MNCIARRIAPAVLLCVPVLTFTALVQAQNSVTASARPAISVLDSTKEQDGLVGSVRRVKTETARIEIRDGRPVEGPPKLVELTTYGIKGNRIENTSYPLPGSLVGKEEYKYDDRGNITEMTLRDERGAILSREAYTYEFDRFGNWTSMVTSLVVFENGELKREPVEVTRRTFTYYFTDNIARMVETPKTEAPKAVEASKAVETPKTEVTTVETPKTEVISARSVPEPTLQLQDVDILSVGYSEPAIGSPEIRENPPALNRRREQIAGAGLVAVNETAAPASSASVPESTAPSASAPGSTPAYETYMTGRSRFDAGDAKGAVEAYLQSIKLEPKSAEVYLNLGHAYLQLQKDSDAIKAFKQSIKLNPDQPETQYGLGLVSFRTGRFREAADAFKKATTLNPDMAKAHYGLSLAYQELDQTNGVLEEYRILEKLDKSLAKKLAQTFPQYNFSCRRTQGCP